MVSVANRLTAIARATPALRPVPAGPTLRAPFSKVVWLLNATEGVSLVELPP